MKSRLTTFLAALLLAIALAGGEPSAARADGGDNTAVAINTKDGSTVFKLAFAIRRVAGDVVDQQNAAVSYASCTDCQTVAVAIEIVLVEGSPSIVTPTNVALAINESCTLCTTAALAYQFVLGTGGPVRFTAEGLRELARIKNELERLRVAFEHGDLTLSELKARLDELIDRVEQILQTQLVSVAAGEPENKGPPPPSPPAPTATSETSTQETTTVPTTTTTETATAPTTTTETTTTPTETAETTTTTTTTTTP